MEVSSQMIKDKLKLKKAQLIILKNRHNNLSQIDMLSSEGSHLRKAVNLLQGEISCLKWLQKPEIEF